jgi:hypothetical protein
MNDMRRTLALAAVAATLLSCPAVEGADHIAAPDAVQARLEEAAAQRTADLAAVEAVLATPLAEETAARMGTDIGRVRAAVPSLSDAELADLSARAAALQSDPVAGMDRQMRLLLMIALILVIIVLVLAIVD